MKPEREKELRYTLELLYRRQNQKTRAAEA